MDSDRPDGAAPRDSERSASGAPGRPRRVGAAGCARSHWHAAFRRSTGRRRVPCVPRGGPSGNGCGHPPSSHRRSVARGARSRRPLVRAAPRRPCTISLPGPCTGPRQGTRPSAARWGAGRSPDFRSGRSSFAWPSRSVPQVEGERRSAAFRCRSRPARGCSGPPDSTGGRNGRPARLQFARFRGLSRLEPFHHPRRGRRHRPPLRFRTVPSRTGRWVRSGGSSERSSAVPPRRPPREPPRPQRPRWPPPLNGRLRLPRLPGHRAGTGASRRTRTPEARHLPHRPGCCPTSSRPPFAGWRPAPNPDARHTGTRRDVSRPAPPRRRWNGRERCPPGPGRSRAPSRGERTRA